MRKIISLAFMLIVFMAFTVSAKTLGEDATMKVKLKNVKDADKATKVLKKVEGVSEVTADASGNLTIKYDKSKTGCCANMSTALKNGGIKFEDAKSNKCCGGKSSCVKSNM